MRGRRRQVRAAAISVNVCTPPSANAIKIAVTLLVTDRPGSVELPANVVLLISLPMRFPVSGGKRSDPAENCPAEWSTICGAVEAAAAADGPDLGNASRYRDPNASA